MTVIKNKSTRTLILVMSVLFILGLVASKIYYSGVNKTADPRVVPAREMYQQYNSLAQANRFEEVLLLLDSIETIYNSVEHYKNSFEIGVLYNNKAATYLTVAMIIDSVAVQSLYLSNLSKDSLLAKSEQAVKQSIKLYENWKKEYVELSLDQVKQKLETDFAVGLNSYSAKELEGFIANRVDEIEKAQFEIDRRLSVAYTNYGIIYRHKKQLDQAVIQYKTAMDLWDRNLTAENNLNILLGRPLKKRNFIQKLFPPKKDETKN